MKVTRLVTRLVQAMCPDQQEHWECPECTALGAAVVQWMEKEHDVVASRGVLVQQCSPGEDAAKAMLFGLGVLSVLVAMTDEQMWRFRMVSAEYPMDGMVQVRVLGKER